jgi:hypothetical protein
MKRVFEQMAVRVSALLASARRLSGHKNASKGRTTMIGLISLAAVGPLASPALAASDPQVTITCTGTNSCIATGTGFTPSGRVLAQAYAGSSDLSSTYLVASAPSLVCITGGLKPICHEVGGGGFSTALPVDYGLACNATSAGAAKYTDVSSGAVVSKPIIWTGPCTGATTTTLTLPSTLDTGWTPSVNPARVTAGSTSVTSGTITITVNGSFFCQYSAGAISGCTSHLPAGTDQVEASYSGSTVPPYYPSSASATVTVLPVDPSMNPNSSNWAGYVDTGDKFTAVSASWTVPKANCGFLETSSSATWVGIDGWNESTVEQIGTDSNCILGQGEYWAWWEMYPGGPQVIGTPTLSSDDAVYPGDLMKANVTSTGTPGWYTLSIADDTQGWTYATTQFYPNANGGTAECIEEQPAAAGLPLTNFGSVTFNQCNATGSDGIATPIWDHPNLAVDMTSGSTLKATVSPLSDDGTTFTVTWEHN